MQTFDELEAWALASLPGAWAFSAHRDRVSDDPEAFVAWVEIVTQDADTIVALGRADGWTPLAMGDGYRHDADPLVSRQGVQR